MRRVVITTTVDSDDRVVDLSKFIVEQTIAILRGAPETLEIARNRADHR